MLSPINQRIAKSIRRHIARQGHTSSIPVPETKRRKRGRLFSDRDYHVHLGGAIPPSFVAHWIRAGRLTLDDEIPDLVAASSSGTSSNTPIITVRDALLNYRGAVAHEIDLKGRDLFLAAYNTPAYTSLPTFLTLYRAYSRRELLYEYASRIARGDLVHPFADVRVSVPHPNAEESPWNYAQRALEEMKHFRTCLLPTQQLFVTFPRQTFNARKNWKHFASFVDLLESTTRIDPCVFRSGSRHHLAFDFAGQPLSLSETIPLLEKLRSALPSAFICYHHGELCPIPFSERVRDTQRLLTYVNRIGHGLCLGLAVLGINPDYLGSKSTVEGVSPAAEEEAKVANKDVAYQCLYAMAKLNIGVEVSPTCNVTLGGAKRKQVLRAYVKDFLDAGVDIFLGSDDPGFLGTSLDQEAEMLKGVDKE